MLFVRLARRVSLLAACVLIGAPSARTGEPRRAGWASSDQLGGARRAVVYVSTDKPIYRPGEAVYIRGVRLEHGSRRPSSEPAAGALEVLNARGTVVERELSEAQDSTFGFCWRLSRELAGGIYRARIRVRGITSAERRFEVRAYRAPASRSRIRFSRAAYGAGGEVDARLEVSRVTAGASAGARVSATARLDGEVFARRDGALDALGRFRFGFRLPEALGEGRGSVAFVVRDGSELETLTKTIPFAGPSIELGLYPEGGELIPGVPTRVYFEAKGPGGRPLDVAGVVVDGGGAEVARFVSEHQGRGHFELRPRGGGRYSVRFDPPFDEQPPIPLPAVRATGVSLRAVDGVVGSGQPIRLEVRALSWIGAGVVTLSRGERVVAERPFHAGFGAWAPIEFDDLGREAEGVLIATAWSAQGRPLAERLVFRAPSESLGVQVAVEGDGGGPGDRVTLTVRTTGAGGEPVPAVVGLTVTDAAVLGMVAPHERAPSLAEMVLLETEVSSLGQPGAYLGQGRALDLLLATQGWRRFAFVDAESFARREGAAGCRVLASAPPPSPPPPRLWVAGARRFKGKKKKKRSSRERPPPPPAPVEPEQPEDSEPAPSPVWSEDDAWLPLEKSAAGEAPGVYVRREYAHARGPGRASSDRRDFTETLYWHRGVKTDARGEARVSFELSDRITKFRVLAEAIGARGQLGSAERGLVARRGLTIDASLPTELVFGDRILAPVKVTRSAGGAARVDLLARSSAGLGLQWRERSATLSEDGSLRTWLPITAERSGRSSLNLNARSGALGDAVTRPLRVRRPGFPVELGFGGLLRAGAPVGRVVRIPDTVVAGSVRCAVKLQPSSLATLGDALQRLIREPYGCFEQTSSVVFPLIMAQQYFLTHSGVEPGVVDRSEAKLARGYRRLLGFECATGGFEWFGRGEGHDTLTAYGLLEFTELRRVFPVDPSLLRRTRAWLLGRRDGRGGFLPRPGGKRSWRPAPEIATAYCVWALLEAGVDGGLGLELSAIRAAVEASDDTYLIALGARVFKLAGKRADLDRALERLKALQGGDGLVVGAKRSAVGGGGRSLSIEATGLAILAWLDEPGFDDVVDRAVEGLRAQCRGGRFGSTQATIIALRAIVESDARQELGHQEGVARLRLDGEPVGEPVSFSSKAGDSVALPDISARLAPGEHRVELELLEGRSIPYTLTVDYGDVAPAPSAASVLHFELRLADTEVTEGALVELATRVVNRSTEAVSCPTVVIGLPAGLEPRYEQLKELVAEGRIAAYETRGCELVIYWSGLGAEAEVELDLELVAVTPGLTRGRPSRAYLYYDDDAKAWSSPLKVDIRPRKNAP